MGSQALKAPDRAPFDPAGESTAPTATAKEVTANTDIRHLHVDRYWSHEH